MAGFEILPFGLLVFVVGVLMVVNAWAVVDAKLAVASAAREATRAYVEAPDAGIALFRAETAAVDAVTASGRRPERLALRLVEGGFARCRLVRIEAAYPVPIVLLPWLGSPGTGFTASARSAEVMDPYRHGVPNATGTCDGIG